MKKALVGLAVLVVVAAAGIYFFLGNLDSIIRTAIEKIGSDMTQTRVVLDEVDIELTTGRGSLRGFRVTNPEGFSDGDTFKFEEISLRIDISSIRSDPVVIREIVVQAPEIAYEFGADGSSNLDRLNEAVQSRSGDGGASDDGDVPNIVIENLIMRDGKIAVVAPLLNEKILVPLPTVHMKDIGKGGKGATPEEIADQVLASVLKAAQSAVAETKIDIRQLTGSAVEETGRILEKALEGAGEAGKEAGDAVRGLIESIGR